MQAVQAQYCFKNFRNAGNGKESLRTPGKTFPDYAQDYTLIPSSTLFQKLFTRWKRYKDDNHGLYYI
jgi:hypothetical protein